MGGFGRVYLKAGERHGVRKAPCQRHSSRQSRQQCGFRESRLRGQISGFGVGLKVYTSQSTDEYKIF